MDNDTQIQARARADQAIINVTWGGRNYDLPDPVSLDITDQDVRAIVSEVIRSGSYGIPADQDVGPLANFRIERDPPNATHAESRIIVRPKTEFGR